MGLYQTKKAFAQQKEQSISQTDNKQNGENMCKLCM
jgi:hypothetical protein